MPHDYSVPPPDASTVTAARSIQSVAAPISDAPQRRGERRAVEAAGEGPPGMTGGASCPEGEGPEEKEAASPLGLRAIR